MANTKTVRFGTHCEVRPERLGWMKMDNGTWVHPSGRQYVFPPGQREVLVIQGNPSEQEISALKGQPHD